jgi:hypothetical protein
VYKFGNGLYVVFFCNVYNWSSDPLHYLQVDKITSHKFDNDLYVIILLDCLNYMPRFKLAMKDSI